MLYDTVVANKYTFKRRLYTQTYNDMAGAAAKGLAVLGKKFAPKLLKLLGKSVGSAIAGLAVNRVANKLFGSG